MLCWHVLINTQSEDEKDILEQYIPAYQRAWPMPSEVSVVLCNKTKRRKCIPARDSRTKFFQNTVSINKTRGYVVTHETNKKTASRSSWLRIPIVIHGQPRDLRCVGALRISANLLLWERRKGFPSAPDEIPLLYTQEPADSTQSQRWGSSQMLARLHPLPLMLSSRCCAGRRAHSDAE